MKKGSGKYLAADIEAGTTDQIGIKQMCVEQTGVEMKYMKTFSGSFPEPEALSYAAPAKQNYIIPFITPKNHKN